MKDTLLRTFSPRTILPINASHRSSTKEKDNLLINGSLQSSLASSLCPTWICYYGCYRGVFCSIGILRRTTEARPREPRPSGRLLGEGAQHLHRRTAEERECQGTWMPCMSKAMFLLALLFSRDLHTYDHIWSSAYPCIISMENVLVYK